MLCLKVLEAEGALERTDNQINRQAAPSHRPGQTDSAGQADDADGWASTPTERVEIGQEGARAHDLI